jgi:acyl-CoA dehydrogenase
VHRTIFDESHDAFREVVRKFLQQEAAPEQHQWIAAGAPPRRFFDRVAELGVMGMQIPAEYGGGGVSSYKFNAIFTEEAARAGVQIGSLRTHLDMALSYLLHYANADQRKRWLPGCASGQTVLALAMTEPGTGSDLAAISTKATPSGDGYLIRGAKTFITGMVNADLVLAVVRTGPSGEDRRTGLSLIAVETDQPGFVRGPLLDKIGMKAQDTSEISFDDVWVPRINLIGEEGQAFSYLSHNLAQERLSIGINAQAMAQAALTTTLEYVDQRRVFGQKVGDFQNSKFELAECATEIEAGQALVDRALDEHDAGTLAPADAAMVKLFCTQMQGRVVDRCLQLHGGYGYINESPIARMYADARVTRIYGGSSEVLRSVIAKTLMNRG